MTRRQPHRVVASAIVIVALGVGSTGLNPTGLNPTAHVARAASAHESEYVTTMFSLFLGRSPTTSELAQASAMAMTTNQGRIELLQNLTSSREWYVRSALDLYRRILHRDADPAGFLHWVAAFASRRATLDEAEARFYASDEYIGAASIDTWIDRVYVEMFGRAADPQGRQNWAAAAQSRGRLWVARRLVGSTEARNRRIAEDYTRILGRPVDPGGLEVWAAWESAHGQVSTWIRLAASIEAYGPLRPGEQVAEVVPIPLPAQLAHNGLATKLVTVQASGWTSATARFTAWERSVVGWQPVLGPWTAYNGSRGWSLPSERHEGSRTSPTGRYSFSAGFGLAANPGYGLGWFVVGPHDYWTSDPSRPDYNTHQLGPMNPAAAPWSSAEHLIDQPIAYRYAAVIDFNLPPSGPYGSAIFLHVSTGGPTAGCVSLPEPQLLQTLRWIDRGTRIVMGPDSVIRSF